MRKTPLAVLSRRLGLFTALASFALTVPSLAQSVWTGSADNEFSNGSNWSPALPGSADAAEVDNGSPQVTNGSEIRTLDVDGGNVTITNTGALTVTNGSTLNAGSISINAGGALNSNVELNGGNLSVDGDLNGRLTLNNGNVSVNGTLDSAVVGAATSLTNNGQTGDVDVSSGGTFVNNSGAVTGATTNAGTASNAGTIGSLSNTAGNFTNNTGGTITGKTTVAGGTVTNNFVVTDADVAAAAAFVNNNGATAGHVSNSGTVSNAGTIASVQNDAGNFTNNFGGEVTGATTVAGGSVTNNATLGTVAVGQGSTFTNTTGASAGAVTNAGAASNAGTIAALTNTAGNFANNAGGTITGKTTVAGGTVTNNFVVTDADVAAAAAFVNNNGATAGNVRNAGTVSNAGTIASLDNQAGHFTNNGDGKVTGMTTVAGGTVVNNAVLGDVEIGAAGTFTNNSGASAGRVTTAGTASNDGTIASLTISDGRFANTGTISGTATVSGGALINNGTISGRIDVFDSGLLSGTGVVGGLTVGADGVLSPGPGIAVATVNGDVTFRSGSVYQLDVDATGLSDRLAASGAVSVEGGRLDVLAGSGSYAPTTDYRILTAGSVTGTFDQVTSNFAFLSPMLSYGPTSIDLRLDRNDVSFAELAETANSRAAAEAAEALSATDPLALAVLSLDAKTAGRAFSQLTGEVHASLKSELLWESRLPREAVLARTTAAGASHTLTDDDVFWTAAYGATNRLSGDGNAAGVDAHVAGVVFGADAEISDDWRLGGILGYSHLTTQPQATVDSYHAGLYLTGEGGPLTLTGGAIYSRNEVATVRNISFGQFSDRLRADYESDTAQVFADLSWTLQADQLKLQPFANLAYVHLDTDDFRELGGPARLSADEASDALALSTIGIRWWADLPATEVPVELSGMLGWRHAAGDLSPSARLAFADPGFFTIAGVPLPRDALVVEAGLSARISETAWLALTYMGEFADGVQSSAGRARLLVNF
ncbi:autotransporter domain-containing protein (plasmid) [Ensifer adhaerens]|uniref:autotransporter outer membrane beta-barrel domain-containing protein n=1 Tax=Ensifer adhaerens TaxID=106592 RepID=UPI0023A95D9A|nr:autotransporter domain-containing protein [Ensifer adhaerens]WDZ79833.1 autotransporter domain-containing protein [Ensifer adhaerens]